MDLSNTLEKDLVHYKNKEIQLILVNNEFLIVCVK